MSYVFPSARKARAFCVDLADLGVYTRRWEAFVEVAQFVDWPPRVSIFDWQRTGEFAEILSRHEGRVGGGPSVMWGHGIEHLPVRKRGPTYRPVGRSKGRR